MAKLFHRNTSLEYGEAELEIPRGAVNSCDEVLLFDVFLIATVVPFSHD